MNYLRQFILFAREGKIYKRTLEDQQHQAKCLNLVTNAIVLWNTIYMGKVIEQLELEGWDIVAEDLQHISPARGGHINPYGRFRFDMKQVERTIAAAQKPKKDLTKLRSLDFSPYLNKIRSIGQPPYVVIQKQNRTSIDFPSQLELAKTNLHDHNL